MRILLMCVIAAMGAACATAPPYIVTVDGLAAPAAAASRTYELRPLDPYVGDADLQFLEFAAYTRRALGSQGYLAAPEGGAPDLIIALGYGVGEPVTHVGTTSQPVIGRTGVSSATTTTTRVTDPETDATTETKRTDYTPSYGVVGYRTETYSYTTYDRYIVLDAVFAGEVDAAGAPRAAFRTTITSTGSTGDLRRVFPVMLAGAMGHIGADTGASIRVRLTDEDSRVVFMTAPGVALAPAPPS